MCRRTCNSQREREMRKSVSTLKALWTILDPRHVSSLWGQFLGQSLKGTQDDVYRSPDLNESPELN